VSSSGVRSAVCCPPRLQPDRSARRPEQVKELCPTEKELYYNKGL